MTRINPNAAITESSRSNHVDCLTLTYHDKVTNAQLKLTVHDPTFAKKYGRQTADRWLTIAWNSSGRQNVVIDEIEYDFPPNSILPLVANQLYKFEKPEHLVVWQFNRDFYCIADHDHEVGCVGFLFYGSSETMFVRLDETEQHKIAMLFEVFKDEFGEVDSAQGQMLRMLLVRLMIKITRLAKIQYNNATGHDDAKFDLYRQFNVLVETHFRKQREVQFYASALNKAPKTIANVFATYGKRSPSEIIYDRIILEAKRLIAYTNKSTKEISAELGFEDASHFSKFFKKRTGLSPSDFAKAPNAANKEN